MTSPYRDPRVVATFVLLTSAAVGLILLINALADGGMRTAATIAVAVALWLPLTAVLRRLREAIFVFGCPPDTLARVLDAVQGTPGLDVERFARDLQGPEALAAYRADWEETRRPNAHVRALPGDWPGIGNMKQTVGVTVMRFPHYFSGGLAVSTRSPVGAHWLPISRPWRRPCRARPSPRPPIRPPTRPSHAGRCTATCSRPCAMSAIPRLSGSIGRPRGWRHIGQLSESSARRKTLPMSMRHSTAR